MTFFGLIHSARGGCSNKNDSADFRLVGESANLPLEPAQLLALVVCNLDGE